MDCQSAVGCCTQRGSSMSGPEINFNILAKNAEEAANDLFVGAAECVTELLDCLPSAQVETLKKHPMLAFTHALLQHLDNRSEERRIQQDAMIEALHDLRESIDFQAARNDDDAAIAPTDLEQDVIYRAVKGDWMHLNRNREIGEQEFKEAMTRCKILAEL